MTFAKLMNFAAGLFYSKEQHDTDVITARLTWRDDDGRVVKIAYADIGYCAGLKPEIRIEMNSERDEP